MLSEHGMEQQLLLITKWRNNPAMPAGHAYPYGRSSSYTPVDLIGLHHPIYQEPYRE